MFEIVCGVRVRSQNAYDQDIARSVIEANRYLLPEKFAPEDVIVDIGAHVGSFAYACLTRGAGKVHAFEPDPENIRLCAANLKRFGQRVVLRRAAVWRSDTSDAELNYTGPVATAKGPNYGGGNVVFEDGLQIPVKNESLDSILSNIRCVRLLKLDCESSEWPILFTSRLLECVDEIVGEYHEIGGKYNRANIPPRTGVPGFTSYTVEDLVLFLGRHNFSVETTRGHESNIGTFFAKKRRSVEPSCREGPGENLCFV